MGHRSPKAKDKSNRYRMLQSIVDSGNDLILTMGMDGKIVWGNHRARAFFGVSVIGRDYDSLLFESQSAKGRAEFGLCLKRDKKQMFEVELIRHDGVRITHECAIRRVESGPEGAFETENIVTALFHDISHRKNIETKYDETSRLLKKTLMEMNELRTQLVETEKTAAIGQLAAGVAHEINNPSAFVQSNLNTLGRYMNELGLIFVQYRKLAEALQSTDQTLPGPVRERLNRIESIQSENDIEFIQADIPELLKESKEGMNRIHKIVENLKDFTSPGDGEYTYSDMNGLMDDTLKVVGSQLKYHAGVEKNYSKLPMVRCCAYRINQVFLNILINAAQALKKKGKITIHTRIRGRFVEISIRDNGPGISTKNISKIFNPFFTTKDENQGSGMGLHIAQRIVKEHKGKIEVNSVQGEGAEFRVLLPIA